MSQYTRLAWPLLASLILILLAGCPDPEPDPPDPDPDPPPGVGRLFLIHESADSTPETAAVRNDKAWKDAADGLNLRWLIADDESAEDLLPAVVKAARQCGLPAVVLTDAEGKAVIETVAMPGDKAGMLSLVKKYGGKDDGT